MVLSSVLIRIVTLENWAVETSLFFVFIRRTEGMLGIRYGSAYTLHLALS